MRLLLSGGGDPEDVVPLDQFFVNQIDLQKTVLYVPIAMEASMYSYDECLNWFQTTYSPYGIINVDMCTDFNTVSDLRQYAAIFIGGGNTFKLLKQIQDSRFDKKLLDYIHGGGFVYGSSAGAIIFGKTIGTAAYADENNVNLTDLSGLDLANGRDIICHYSEKDDEFIKNYNNDLYILYEESGLFIHDNKIESIGKKYLTRR